MPSITECDHTIDPSGDVILTLRTPNAPLAVWRGVYDEPASDECLSSSSCSVRSKTISTIPPLAPAGCYSLKKESRKRKKETKESRKRKKEKKKEEVKEAVSNTKDVTFRLVSRQLIRASPVFKAALAGGAWKEGVAVADGDDPNAPPIFRIDVEDWDVEALVIVMNAIHGRAAPLSVTLETLARVAVVVDYYHVREALHHVTPYWLQHLRAVLRIPDSYGRELMLWICISLVFEDVDCLLRATHRAIWEASEERWNADCRELGLPIPPALVDAVNAKRRCVIDWIVADLNRLKKDLLEGNKVCRNAQCRTISLGVLITKMHDLGLEDLGTPEEPDLSTSEEAHKDSTFDTLILSKLTKDLQEIKYPNWGASIHRCPTIMKPDSFTGRWGPQPLTDGLDSSIAELVEKLKRKSVGLTRKDLVRVFSGDQRFTCDLYDPFPDFSWFRQFPVGTYTRYI